MKKPHRADPQHVSSTLRKIARDEHQTMTEGRINLLHESADMIDRADRTQRRVVGRLDALIKQLEKILA